MRTHLAECRWLMGCVQHWRERRRRCADVLRRPHLPARGRRVLRHQRLVRSCAREPARLRAAGSFSPCSCAAGSQCITGANGPMCSTPSPKVGGCDARDRAGLTRTQSLAKAVAKAALKKGTSPKVRRCCRAIHSAHLGVRCRPPPRSREPRPRRRLPRRPSARPTPTPPPSRPPPARQ
jgi:hypothetical protein